MANLDDTLRRYKKAARDAKRDLDMARITCGQIHYLCHPQQCSPACIEAETEMWAAFAAYSEAEDNLREVEWGWRQTYPHPNANCHLRHAQRKCRHRH